MTRRVPRQSQHQKVILSEWNDPVIDAVQSNEMHPIEDHLPESLFGREVHFDVESALASSLFRITKAYSITRLAFLRCQR